MAIELGINTFAIVAEFDAYCADRLDMAAAFEADNASKAAALVSATDLLNEMPWTGFVVNQDQPLAFPRVGSYFDPRVGGNVSLSDIPKRIKQATLELAYHLLNNEGLQDDTGQIKDLQVGSVSMTLIQQAPKIPYKVTNIIRPLLINQGSSGWWRAN